jgi:hypothetical protein
MAINKKTCFRCKAEKPIVDFRKRTTASDGLYSWCRQCEREYRKLRGYDKKKSLIPNGLTCSICNNPVKGGASQYCSIKCKGIASFSVKVGDVFGKLVVLRLNEKAERGNSKSVRWICRCECGKITSVRAANLLGKGRAKTSSCGDRSKHRSGENNPVWKGGRIINSSGYAMVRFPSHPNAHKQGYVAEHVLVMANHLGRPIKKHETVHHKNGIRTDNDLGNLELWTSRHPAGQRVSDMIEFCREYLAEYESEMKLKEVI